MLFFLMEYKRTNKGLQLKSLSFGNTIDKMHNATTSYQTCMYVQQVLLLENPNLLHKVIYPDPEATKAETKDKLAFPKICIN